MVAGGNGGAIVNISSQASKVALKDHMLYCKYSRIEIIDISLWVLSLAFVTTPF